MKSKSLAATVLLLASGSAFADQRIQTVEVRPQAQSQLTFACANPAAARPADVERLLKINDSSQTHQLSNRLMGVVGEACGAGVANIVVQRGANYGSLTWRPARAYEASVALN